MGKGSLLLGQRLPLVLCHVGLTRASAQVRKGNKTEISLYSLVSANRFCHTPLIGSKSVGLTHIQKERITLRGEYQEAWIFGSHLRKVHAITKNK